MTPAKPMRLSSQEPLTQSWGKTVLSSLIPDLRADKTAPGHFYHQLEKLASKNQILIGRHTKKRHGKRAADTGSGWPRPF